MSKNRRSCLAPILADRVRNLENEILVRQPEYRKMQERVIASQETIKNHLPKEHMKAFWEWDASVGAMMAVVSEAMYRQGFVDGCRVVKVVRRLVR